MSKRRTSIPLEVYQQPSSLKKVALSPLELQVQQPNQEAMARMEEARRRQQRMQRRQRARDRREHPPKKEAQKRDRSKKSKWSQQAEETKFARKSAHQKARNMPSNGEEATVVPLIQPIRKKFDSTFGHNIDVMQFDEFQLWLNHSDPQNNLLSLANSDRLDKLFKQFYIFKLHRVKHMFEEEFKDELSFMQFEAFYEWLGKDYSEFGLIRLGQNPNDLMQKFEQFYRHQTTQGTEGYQFAWGERRMPFVGIPTLNKEGANRLRISDEFQSPSGLNVSPKVNVLFSDHFNKGFTVINGRVVKQYVLPDGSIYFKIESPLGKFTAHDSQITFRVLEEDESPKESAKRNVDPEFEKLLPSDHDARASIVKRDIFRRIQEGTDTVELAANFPEWIEKYQLLYMRFSDLGTSSARIIFGINPDYEVKLTGTQVEMRMAGTDVPGTSSKRSYDNAPTIDKGRFNTRVKWLGENLTINGKTDRVGKSMHAFPISQDHNKGSDTSANKKAQEDLMDQMPTGTAIKGKENRYIKGHLLNANLGGPASAENLFPITDKANGQHLNTVEAYIKSAVDAGYVCEYKLEVKNMTAPAKNSSNLYTVDTDFDFDFTRLDTNLKQINKTRHTGVIHSRYGNKPAANYNSGNTDDKKDRKKEFKDDYTGGSMNKPQDPSGMTATAGKLKMSDRRDPATKVGDTPGGKGVSDQIDTVTGFSHAFPPNIKTKTGSGASSSITSAPAIPNLGTISLGSGSFTAFAQSLKVTIPDPITASKKISLFKSNKSDVENYLQAAINGWKLADIQNWVTLLRTTKYGKWDDILKHVPLTNLDTAVATSLIKHMQKTAGITINGSP